MGNGGMMRPMSGPMGGPMNGGFPQQGQPNMQQQMGLLGNVGMNPMMSNSMPNTMSPQMHPQPTMVRIIYGYCTVLDHIFSTGRIYTPFSRIAWRA
jgi:hypothetical protein